MLEAVVVGGGQSGLAASWHLSRRGIEHVVFEQGRVGESWRSQRWDSFALNTPMWANRLPGDGEPAEGRDAFLLRDAWVARLEEYSRSQRVPVRTRVRVTAVERTTREGAFRLTLETPDPETVEARSVILASGFQRVPTLPALAASVPRGIVSIHAADYRRPEALPPGAVLIVGGAQSGGQIAEDLLDAGREVFMSASGVGRLPRRYRGRDIFEWLFGSGFFDQQVGQLPDPRMALAAQPILSGVGPRGHTLSLQLLAGRGATLLGRLRTIGGERVDFAPDLADSIRTADRVSAQVRALVDNGIAAQGVAAPPAELDPADEPVPSPDVMAAGSPGSLDIGRAGISAIVWSTGFGTDLSWVRLPVADERGKPIHREGAASVPGIWFLGVPWMRARKSSILLGADADAAAIVAAVAAFLAT